MRISSAGRGDGFIRLSREKLLTIDTHLTSSGGLKLGRIKPEATRRYQMYGMYSPELIMYGDTSRHDHWNHTLEGLFQYNFNSGLSFDVIDVFHDREEIAGNGIDDTLFRHRDNLFDFITTFESDSRKFKVQFNYANYDLNYKDPLVEYRDRNDNSLGLTLFYKFKPKTSLLAGIRYADIAFDTGTINDNEEIGYYGGISWEVTARSRGTFRLGYLEKDFDDDRVKDQDGFSIELQTQHNFTAKRGVNVMGYRKFHESDLAGASSFLSTGIDIGLLQRFNEKWSGNLNFVYEENEYNGINRDDRFFSDLSTTVRISSGDTIRVPLVGEISVKDLTVSQVAAKIESMLADGYLVSPQVDVFITEHRSKKALILGQIKNPGQYELRGRVTFLEFISEAGGITEDAGNIATIKRTADVDSRQDRIVLDLEKLIKQGDASLNILIQDNDNVYISKADTYYVSGEVEKPDSYKFESNLSVIKAITKAGGFTNIASKNKVRIIRVVSGEKKIFQNVNMDEPVLPDDVIVVPESFF
ncbi:MAG: SLBB domain-containing protein [Desulfobacteraceae bacterium]|nr:SLBB domain-containing protein [Desulfobacteraceae bacterium]